MSVSGVISFPLQGFSPLCGVVSHHVVDCRRGQPRQCLCMCEDGGEAGLGQAGESNAKRNSHREAVVTTNYCWYVNVYLDKIMAVFSNSMGYTFQDFTRH